MELTSIEIDFDIYRKIQGERRGFGEPEYVALRRLLGLSDVVPTSVSDDEGAGEGDPFVEDGVEILHGSDARMLYMRGTQRFEGKFLNGKLVVNGTGYATLSAAASDLARTKEGNKTNLNGWNYWEVRLPGTSRWHSLKQMREQAQERMKQAEKWRQQVVR